MAYPKTPPFLALSPQNSPKFSATLGRPRAGGSRSIGIRSGSPAPRPLKNSRREQIRSILVNKFRSRFNSFESQELDHLLVKEIDTFVAGPALTAARLKALEHALL